jgi:hypothetical protein
MKRLLILATLFCTVGANVQADNVRIELARQIQEASQTVGERFFFGGQLVSELPRTNGWTGYNPRFLFRRVIKLDDCTVRMQYLIQSKVDDSEVLDSEAAFDLSQAILPAPDVSQGDSFALLSVDEGQRRAALIRMDFQVPYEANTRAQIWTGAIETSRPLVYFLMEPVADEMPPRRLLALLNQYQDEYCTFSG